MPDPSIVATPRLDRRVLVVDDEPNQRNMLTRALREMDFDAHAVDSAEHALRIIDHLRPTLALLDLNLPGLGGLDLAEQIRQRLHDTQFIILTGYGDLDAARRALRLDVVDFLLKPCPLGELETAISRAYQRACAASEPTLPRLAPEPPTRARADDDESTQTLDDAERNLIVAALERHDGNRTAAARDLGISVRTLYYRLARYDAEARLRSAR